MEKDFPIFRNYLEEEDDKPYFTVNSLAYYYEDMERKQKLITDMSKLLLGYDNKLNLNLEEMEKRIEAELGKWDHKVEELPETVNDLLTQWVDDGTLTHVIDTTLIEQKVAPLTAQLAEKAAKSEVQGLVTNKADISYVDTKLANIGDAKPSGVYATLAALQTAFPTGNGKNVYLVSADGKWYYWNGTAWTAGGVYQSTGFGENTVQAKNIATSKRTENILNKNDVIVGFYYATVGNPVTFSANTSWVSPKLPIPVKPGDIVRFNLALQSAYFVGVDDNDVVIQNVNAATTAGARTVTVVAGVTKFYTAVFKNSLESTMITVNNPMPSEYTPYEQIKVLDWLDYKPKSILPQHISDDVFNNLIISPWSNKTFISLGDSITWQDGKPYSSSQIIARGYQTILKEKLGFASYNNIGVSGRPMADGTANGVGTVTTGLAQDYTGYDLTTIAAGTNDFKLNVTLGNKGKIGDTTFDRSTYYGAFRTLIEFILTQKPTIRIVLFTPLQRDQGGYDVNTVNPAGHKLIDYVNAVKEIGEMYGLPVCDMYRNSGFTKKTLSTYTMDGLHPNDVGYARMGSYAASFLNAI